MKKIILLVTVASIVIAGCSTARTRYSDPVMRVMIDPDSVDKMNYTRVQRALVSSGKWTVVDRGAAFKAVQKEQERQYKSEKDRFGDKEKWAHYGRLYGVGGVVVAQAQCQPKYGWRSNYLECLQYLAIVDARTGEVITAVENQIDGGLHFFGEVKQAASWEESVNKLNELFPEKFESHSKGEAIETAEEDSVRLQNIINSEKE